MIRHDATGRMVLPGSVRYPGGWLPPLGTIVGPHHGEYLTVVAHEHGRALLSPATNGDLAALAHRDEPHSPTEGELLGRAR